MNEAWTCEQKDRLLTYLYGECDAAERERFEAHLTECASCAVEVRELRDVRGQLAAWAPPDRALGFKIVQEPKRARWWNVAAMPVWATAAAGVVILSAAAAVANLQVRYGPDGLLIRTGWHGDTATPAAVSSATLVGPRRSSAGDVTRVDLAALEQRLRREFTPPASGVNMVANRTSRPDEAELLRRMRALIQESEQRQERELALRVAQLVRDFDVQRRTDLVRFEQGLGRLEGMTGAEVARQREVLNYLVKVSQQR